MSRLLRNFGILFLVALSMTGCSSKSSTTGPGSTAPRLTAPQFHGPSSTSASADTSYGAKTAIQTAALFNSYSQGFMAYIAGNGTESGNSWSWSATENGVTGTWTAISSSSGYNWKFVENGTSGSVTYNNWTALTGTESSDGKSGNWIIYALNSNLPAIQASWSTDANGNVSGTILVYGTDGTTVSEKWIFTNNTDKSGSLEIYTGTVLTLDVKWNANGSGTWAEYDPSTGAEDNSGSWS